MIPRAGSVRPPVPQRVHALLGHADFPTHTASWSTRPSGNTKAITRFERRGFTTGPEVVLPEIDLPDVYLPEKHARLAFLTRETAFTEATGTV